MIVAVLQARTSSSRLPGKVLRPLLGEPMLARQIERIKRARRIDKLIVATSTDRSDDELAGLCAKLNVECKRGSLDDVLDRFYQATKDIKPKHVVRLTGDCPLIDPSLLDHVIETHLTKGNDYTSNCLEPTYPDGLDAEVMTFAALETAWRNAKKGAEREHVTLYINQRPNDFKISTVKSDVNRSHLRWTVDQEEDFRVVEEIYKALYPRRADFETRDVLSLLDQKPELVSANIHIIRNSGLEKSLMKDDQAVLKDSKCPKSIGLQYHAKRRIPGLSQLLSKRPDMFSFGVWPGYFSKAKGVEVWDLDGNKYIDMSIGGIGANVLGYADPDVDEVVISAIKSGCSSSLNCPEEVELADLLCDLHPWASRARFARSGGEAMTIAVRIARAHTGRDRIAFCGYHGWHDWYLAANVGTENALGEHLIAGLSPRGVPKALAGTALPFRYNRFEELEAIFAAHGREIGAIVMEPIRSDPPQNQFLERVRALATQSGAVLVIDEISAGFRMNSGGAHLNLGVTPDIAVFSKAIGNGYAVAGIIGNGVMDAAQETFISSTNWTERVGPTAALATIRKHKRLNAGEHLMAIGNAVQRGWQEMAAKHGLEIHVGGIPPLSHFSFDAPAGLDMKAYYVQLMLERRFLASTSFYSMYAHTQEHVERYLAATDEAFGKIEEAVQAGDLKRRLKGRPATAGFKRLT